MLLSHSPFREWICNTFVLTSRGPVVRPISQWARPKYFKNKFFYAAQRRPIIVIIFLIADTRNSMCEYYQITGNMWCFRQAAILIRLRYESRNGKRDGLGISLRDIEVKSLHWPEEALQLLGQWGPERKRGEWKILRLSRVVLLSA